MPDNPDPSYRISGGSSALTQTLARFFDESRLHLNTVVRKISYRQDHCEIETSQGTFTARTVVTTLPPRLLTQKVELSPTFHSATPTCRRGLLLQQLEHY